MDPKLRDDIKKQFFPEYTARAREQRKGFFKDFDQVSDVIDKGVQRMTFSKLDTPTTLIMAVPILLAFSLPVGLAAFGLWGIGAVLSIASAATKAHTASKQIQKDIENGTLPERYSGVIDARIKGLEEQIADYRTIQRTELPPKGAASAAFTTATTGATTPIDLTRYAPSANAAQSSLQIKKPTT
jgi:hypothetical protein